VVLISSFPSSQLEGAQEMPGKDRGKNPLPLAQESKKEERRWKEKSMK